MNADLFERLTPLLATYLIHSTCLIGAVAAWLRLRPPRSAQLRQAAWKTAMLMGLVTTPLQAWLAIVPWSGQVPLPAWDGLPRPSAGGDGPRSPSTGGGGLGRPSYAARFTQDGRPFHDRDDVLRAPPETPNSDELSANDLSPPRKPAEMATARPASGLQQRATRTNPWYVAPGVAWLAGVFVCGLRIAIGRLRLGGRQALMELERGLERRTLDELCLRAGVRRRVRLYRAADRASPIAWGLVRWHVALPTVLVKRLNHRELRALLAHELGHLVRGDTRWLWLASVIGSVGFFQPLNKLAQQRICREAELLSDRWAVLRTGDRLALARSLTMVAELLIGPRAALAAAAATTRSALRERLEILLDERPLGPARSKRGGRSLAAIVAIVVGAGAVALLPAAKLPRAAAVNLAAAPFASSSGLEEVMEALWQEFDQLEVELGQLDLTLAAAPSGEASAAAERIRGRSKQLRDRRQELRMQMESLTGQSKQGERHPGQGTR